MKHSYPIIILLLAASAGAQPNPAPSPLGSLTVFLSLSDSQMQTILGNNEEYNQLSSEKQRRIYQVQNEIAAETTKEPLDPPALGIRYAEIESICRDLTDRAKSLRARNLDVLNPDQKAKLGVLEEAIRLAPVVEEARGANLAGALSQAPHSFNTASLISAVLSPVFGPPAVPGCQVAALSFRWFDASAFQPPQPTLRRPARVVRVP